MAEPPLGQLGWRGVYQHGSPEVVALREQMDAEAGIEELELVDWSVEGYVERATEIFHRDGFVLVKVPALTCPCPLCPPTPLTYTRRSTRMRSARPRSRRSGRAATPPSAAWWSTTPSGAATATPTATRSRIVRCISAARRSGLCSSTASRCAHAAKHQMASLE